MHGRSASQTVLAAAGVGLVLGVGTGGLLAAWIARLNGWGFGWDVWALGAHLTSLYGVLFVGGFTALAVGALVLGARPGVRFFLAVAAAATVLLNSALRYNLAVQFLSVTPHMSWLGVFNLVVLAIAAGVVLWALLGRGLRVAAGLALAAGLVAVVHFANAARETPIVRDIATEVPEALARTPLAPPAPADERFSDARLVVLALDGLSFEVLLPMLRSGAAPNFRALLDDAAYGYLRTTELPISPVVWETIATGQSRWKHGIGYHVHFDFAGVEERVRALPEFRHGNSPMLLRRLLTVLSPWAPWQRVPANSRDARVARFFDVADSRGIAMGNFRWLNTGPAYPVEGWLEGAGPIAPHTHPTDLPAPPEEETPPPGSDRLDIVRHYDRHERALYDHFVRIALARPTPLLLYYTHFHDGVNHTNWKQEAHGDGFFIRGSDGLDLEPGEAMLMGTRFIDDVLGDVMSRLPEDATLVILSDHGFDFRGTEHDCGPPGVFFARGPGIRPGPFSGAELVDVAPTLLHWLGLPIAEDMEGEILPLAVEGGPLDRPVRHVASYGAGPGLRERSRIATDEEELRKHEEYLRSLGYVN